MKLDYINNRQLTWVSVGVAGVGVATSVYKGIKAHSAEKSAEREANSLQRPAYQIPSEYYENRNVAGQLAEQGLTSAEKQYAGEQRQEGLASSLSALKQTGGGPNDFAGLNKVFDDSLKSQSALDAQQHMQNINFFTKTNEEVAGQKGIQWGLNELQPYETKLKEIRDRRIAAKTNENNAVNEGIGSLSAAATGINSYFKTGGSTTPKQPDYVNLTPYNRTFGLQDTGGGGAGSPAANFGSVDPNSFSTSALIQPVDSSDNS